MSSIIEVTDLSMPELDVYARLTEPQLRSRLEPEKGIFIAESPKVIGTALECGYQPLSFLMEHRHLEGQGKALREQWPDVPVYTADAPVLSALTGFNVTRGLLCAMRRPAPRTLQQVCADARRIAVLEGIVDSTNIGAIFRSAAALNMDGVVLCPRCCDPLCRRAVRVSMGTVFQIPWARISADPAQWPHPGMEMLKAMGFATAAMALNDQSVSVEDPRVRQEEKLAVIMGTEGTGLQEQTIAASDYVVKIPMAHHVDSLNVAAASAVAFWELRAR